MGLLQVLLESVDVDDLPVVASAPVALVAGGRAVVTGQVMALPLASLAWYVLRVALRSTSYRQ